MTLPQRQERRPAQTAGAQMCDVFSVEFHRSAGRQRVTSRNSLTGSTRSRASWEDKRQQMLWPESWLHCRDEN